MFLFLCAGGRIEPSRTMLFCFEEEPYLASRLERLRIIFFKR